MEEKPEISPCLAFRSCVFDEYQIPLIPRKLHYPDKFLVTRLYYNDLSADCPGKDRFINSLVEHFKKIMKKLNVSIFSFIILNLVKRGIIWTLHVNTAADICVKEVIESCLCRVLWRKIMEAMKVLNLSITVLNLVS